MNHSDHVTLIRGGVVSGVWADFGSGGGAFTLALADLLGAGAEFYSIDRDARVLDEQRAAMQRQFPDRRVHYQAADFTHKIDLPPLDGILMANSLHFVRQKDPVLRLMHGYLKLGAPLIIVEYNTDQGNTWVPYPFSFETWRTLANKNGFKDTRQLHVRSSRFLNEIYSAISISTSA